MSNDRFDKFTERARKVLTLAQEEATRFNHNYIGTEHLLLGLVREGEGVAAKVLTSMGVDLNRVRSAVEFIIGRGDRMIVGEVGLTPRAKKVIELAVDEARQLGHHYIGTEHLLLGLVREGEGIGAGVLESLGVSLKKARTQTIQILARGITNACDPPAPQPSTTTPALPSHPLTDDAREVLLLAKEYAGELKAEMIEPEHILLGIVDGTPNAARAMLEAMGIDMLTIRARLIGSPGQRQADLIDAWLVGKIAETSTPSGLSPAARGTVEHALEEAIRLSDDHIDSVHLLLALLHPDESTTLQYLAEYDVTIDRARAFVVDQREKEKAEIAAKLAEAAARKEKAQAEAVARFAEAITKKVREQAAAAAQVSARSLVDTIGQAMLLFSDDPVAQEQAAIQIVGVTKASTQRWAEAVDEVVQSSLGDVDDKERAEATAQISAAAQLVANTIIQVVQQFQFSTGKGQQGRVEAGARIGSAIQSMGDTVAHVAQRFRILGPEEQYRAISKLEYAGRDLSTEIRQAAEAARRIQAQRRPGFIKRFLS